MGNGGIPGGDRRALGWASYFCASSVFSPASSEAPPRRFGWSRLLAKLCVTPRPRAQLQAGGMDLAPPAPQCLPIGPPVGSTAEPGPWDGDTCPPCHLPWPLAASHLPSRPTGEATPGSGWRPSINSRATFSSVKTFDCCSAVSGRRARALGSVWEKEVPGRTLPPGRGLGLLPTPAPSSSQPQAEPHPRGEV